MKPTYCGMGLQIFTIALMSFWDLKLTAKRRDLWRRKEWNLKYYLWRALRLWYCEPIGFCFWVPGHSIPNFCFRSRFFFSQCVSPFLCSSILLSAHEYSLSRSLKSWGRGHSHIVHIINQSKTWPRFKHSSRSQHPLKLPQGWVLTMRWKNIAPDVHQDQRFGFPHNDLSVFWKFLIDCGHWFGF